MLTHRFIRFLLVGAINTAVGYSLFALLVFAGLAYPVAIALATVGGVIWNFYSTRTAVFGNARNPSFLRFAAIYFLVYLINVAAVAVLLKLGFNVYLANAFIILPLAFVTYGLQRHYVFYKS
ncbi:MAG: GtrA family protein [Pseudomonadota bacterium]